jgi:hypothetical protein
MVSFRNLLASALAISGGIALGAMIPAADVSLFKRGRADIVREILKAIGVLTVDTVYTWASSILIQPPSQRLRPSFLINTNP